MRTGIVVLIATALLVGTSQSFAETQYSGRAGVEYDVHDYQGSASGFGSPEFMRQFFKHDVSFAARGTLPQEKYGSWLFGLSVTGYFDRASGELGVVDNYYAPDLKNIRTSLSLVPKSRIPTVVSYVRQHIFSTDYEEKNRYVVTTDRPTLAVIRKYETDRETFAVATSFVASDALKIKGTYSTNSQQQSRLYDFNEDQDLFSLIVPQRSAPGQSQYFISFTNTLPEAVTVLMDDTTLIQTLEPNIQQLIYVDAGRHRFDIRAPSYNTFITTQDVQSNLLWTVRYNAPAAPDDRRVSADSKELSASYVSGTDFRNDFRLSSEGQDDEVRGTVGNTLNATNTLLYTLGQRTTLQGVSSYNRMKGQTGDQPEETQSGINHATTLTFEKDVNTTMGVSHNLSRLENRGLKTLVNTVESQVTKKFNYRYEAALKLRGTQQTNNLDFTGREINIKTNHKYRDVDLKIEKAMISDEFEIKIAKESNPDRKRNEYINRFRILHDFGRVAKVGQITLSTDYVSRWQSEATGSIYEGRYIVGLVISNREWSRLDFTTFLTREQSKTTGTGSQAGVEFASNTFRMIGRLLLTDNAALSASLMMVDQLEVDIQRAQVDLSWVWPIAPVRHSLRYESENKMYGGDDNERFQSFSQILSLRWRQIIIALEHEIAYEDVRLGSSRYQGVQVTAERGFSL